MKIKTRFEWNNSANIKDYLPAICFSLGILLSHLPLLRGEWYPYNSVSMLCSSLLVGAAIYILYVVTCGIIAIDRGEPFIWETSYLSIRAVPPSSTKTSNK